MTTTALLEAPVSARSATMPHRSDFLHELYDGAPRDHWFVVSAFPSKTTRAFPATFDGISEAVLHIDRIDDGYQNVFTSMGLLAAPPQTGRGKMEDVEYLTCLWMDGDVKDGCFETKEDAIAAARAMPLQPSLLTSSGKGIHAFWIFKRALSLVNADERALVYELLKRWQTVVCRTAEERGGKVDKGTFDASRVMRVSGTWHAKVQPPTATYIIEQSEVRYTYEDFDAVLPALPTPPRSIAKGPGTTPSVIVIDGDLQLDPDAQPPFAKFEALMSNDMRFAKTWKRDRRDLADTSASAYCLALANGAVGAGWGDQEITDLLIAWRRKYGEDLKLNRSDNWYARTIEKARAESGIVSPIAPVQAGGDEAGPVTDARGEALAVLQRHPILAGVPIAGVRKLGHIGGHIELILKDGSMVPLGTAGDAIKQSRVQGHIADATQILIRGGSPQEWRTIAQAILTAAGPGEDIGTDEDIVTRSWLSNYLSWGPSIAVQEPVDLSKKLHLVRALLNIEPTGIDHGAFWATDKSLVVKVENLVAWLTSDLGRMRISHNDAKLQLGRLGFTPKLFEARYSQQALNEEFPGEGNIGWKFGSSDKGDSRVVKRRVMISPPNWDQMV